MFLILSKSAVLTRPKDIKRRLRRRTTEARLGLSCPLSQFDCFSFCGQLRQDFFLNNCKLRTTETSELSWTLPSGYAWLKVFVCSCDFVLSSSIDFDRSTQIGKKELSNMRGLEASQIRLKTKMSRSPQLGGIANWGVCQLGGFYGQ